MEGRGYSEFCRNTSEEIFIKTIMDCTIGMPAPSTEMLGFKNITQNFRADSEELFKNWLTNGENNGFHSTGTAHRPRQTSRRMSTELASLGNQNGGPIQKKLNDDMLHQQTSSMAADSSNELNTTSFIRNGVEKGPQASDLFLAKAWFHSSQPMTRSRSSELRRRYVARQNLQTPLSISAMNEASENGVNGSNQEHTDANGFNNISACMNPNNLISPSNSSSSIFDNPLVENMDNISSVVSMLKGTLERKKLNNQVAKEAIDSASFGYYNHEQEIHAFENQETFHTLGVAETRALQTIEESLLEGIMGPLNPTQMSTSESSGATPVVSNGFDVFDDPYIAAQAHSICESSMNHMRTRMSQEDCSRTTDFGERIYDNSKEDQKRGSLIRYGSVTSAGSVDRGDPTKKRRVERSRKMAEAKERSSTPAIPSDMQSILKRCENLEKEVRSLKLNLAFMSRKDSEQTKQIEELKKQNSELADEKERLLEEIERMISVTGKICN